MATDASNLVVQGLLTKQHFPFFHKHLIDYRSIQALGQSEKARSFERQVSRLQPAPVHASEEAPADAQTDREVIARVQRLYVDNEEPLLKSKEYKTLELMDRVLAAHQFYDFEVKQGAGPTDEEALRHQLVSELAQLQKRDPKKLRLARDGFHREVSDTLEHILRSHRLKAQTVDIDKRFAGVGRSLEEDSASQHEEHTLAGADCFSEPVPLATAARPAEAPEAAPATAPVEINFDFKAVAPPRDFVRENMVAVMDPKSVLKLIARANPPLVAQNIPRLAQETGFGRAELHTFYILYKALCCATSQRYGLNEYDVSDGIDDKVFRKGVYQVFIQNDELAEKIFGTIDYNYSRFMNWPEFISGMQMIKAKTLADKIGLFIKLADSDGNGLLDAKEILSFCRASITRFINPEYADFVESLVQYFKKFIFATLGFDEDQEIPLASIREHILKGLPGSTLLAMFCGADF